MQTINIYRNDYSDYDSGFWQGVQSEYTLQPSDSSVNTVHGCVAQSRGDSVLHGTLCAPDNAEIAETITGEVRLYIGRHSFSPAEILIDCVADRFGPEYKYRTL